MTTLVENSLKKHFLVNFRAFLLLISFIPKRKLHLKN